jgi:putative heme-binding domain-containing protein
VAGKSNAELAQIISNGLPDFGMPAFRLLGEAEIKNVLEYLRTLQGRRTDAPVPGDPRNGRTLFFGAASCSTCHRALGEGSFSAPDLSTYGEGKLANEIRAAITSPGSSSPGRVRIATVVTQDGARLAGTVRNEDNFSVQLQSDDGALHFLLKSELASLEYQSPPPMPADYGTKLSAKELDDLVSYLHSLKSTEDSSIGGEDSQ